MIVHRETPATAAGGEQYRCMYVKGIPLVVPSASSSSSAGWLARSLAGGFSGSCSWGCEIASSHRSIRAAAADHESTSSELYPLFVGLGVGLLAMVLQQADSGAGSSISRGMRSWTYVSIPEYHPGLRKPGGKLAAG